MACATRAVCSLSRLRERGGERVLSHQSSLRALSLTLSRKRERERTAFAARVCQSYQTAFNCSASQSAARGRHW